MRANTSGRGDDAILFVGGQPPIRCKKIRYFSEGSFLGDIKAPPEIMRSPDGYPLGPKVEPSEWFKKNFELDDGGCEQGVLTDNGHLDCELA